MAVPAVLVSYGLSAEDAGTYDNFCDTDPDRWAHGGSFKPRAMRISFSPTSDNWYKWWRDHLSRETSIMNIGVVFYALHSVLKIIIPFILQSPDKRHGKTQQIKAGQVIF